MTHALLFVVSASVVSASPLVQVLELDHPVWDVTVGELTHDGINDILVFSVDDDPKTQSKYLTVFAGDEKGGYGPVPTAVLAVPWSFGTAFLAQTDDTPALEVVLARHDLLQVLHWVDGAFVYGPRVALDSLLPSGTREPIFLRDAVFDLDNDGIDEWLIPLAEGYAIVGPGGVRARLEADLSSEMRFFGRVEVQHSFPRAATFVQPETTEYGVALLSGERVDFYFGEAWGERRTHYIPVETQDKWSTSAVLTDIDNDGFPDIVVSQMQGTINLSVQSNVYLAKGPFDYPEEPSAYFESKGAFSLPTLHDVDGDGRLDLVFLGVSLGVRNIINYFVRGKIAVEVDVYLFSDGGYPQSAHDRVRLTLDAPDGNENVAYVLGDFTGDGRADALVATSAERLGLFEGDARKVMNTRPVIQFDLPAFGTARRTDLNQNGRDDAIIFHRQSDVARRVEVLVF